MTEIAEGQKQLVEQLVETQIPAEITTIERKLKILKTLKD
jgi:hypothetical protein